MILSIANNLTNAEVAPKKKAEDAFDFGPVWSAWQGTACGSWMVVTLSSEALANRLVMAFRHRNETLPYGFGTAERVIRREAVVYALRSNKPAKVERRRQSR